MCDGTPASLRAEPATSLVRRLAQRKAQVVTADRMTGQVLGADTAVAADGHIFSKPVDAVDAVRMLRVLRSRRHTVATGVAVVDLDRGRVDSDVVVAYVTMRAYSEAEIAEYVASGEPLDKAGAYAIQGDGAASAAELDGPLDTVIGLPLDATARLLDLPRRDERRRGAFRFGSAGLDGPQVPRPYVVRVPVDGDPVTDERM